MNTKKRENLLVYTALAMGILCFVFTFTFFRIVMIGYMSGDYSMFAFTFIGVMLSIFSIVKTKKRLVPILSLLLSLSFPLLYIVWIVLLMTGVTDFAP